MKDLGALDSSKPVQFSFINLVSSVKKLQVSVQFA